METLSWTSAAREQYWRENLKVLYCRALKSIRRDDKLKAFSYKLRDSYQNFTMYIIYYLEPLFDEMRSSGEIIKSK